LPLRLSRLLPRHLAIAFDRLQHLRCAIIGSTCHQSRQLSDSFVRPARRPLSLRLCQRRLIRALPLHFFFNRLPSRIADEYRSRRFQVPHRFRQIARRQLRANSLSRLRQRNFL